MSDGTGLRRFVTSPSARAPAGAVQPGQAEAGPAPAEEQAQPALPGTGTPQAPAEPAAAERCELCATEVPAGHGHVADLDQSSLMCACRACYLLFTHEQAGRGKYRAVPDRYLSDPEHPLTQADWEALEIPVGLAFFLHSSRQGEVAGFYPSPAGATQCRLDLGSWERVAAAHPLLTATAPDVEAILVSQGQSGTECFLVPIDACYELAGRMRLLWRGFDGGEQARQSIADFLAEVRARSRPLEP